MPAPCTRRSPVWSSAELLDLISIWEEEAVQSQLRSSRRNYDTYRQISRCMTERGNDWDTLQCRVKLKKLQNAYRKAWEANRRSGAAPMSCQFYKELDAILGGNPTSTAKAILDTSVARMPVNSGPSQEEEILDEDVEGVRDPEAEDNSEVRGACSQERFSTPEKATQSQLSELGEAQTGEEASVAHIHCTVLLHKGSDSKLQPDVVVTDEAQKKIILVDVTVSFENRTPAFREARARKLEKYAPLADTLKAKSYEVQMDALIVGALGAWDPCNNGQIDALIVGALGAWDPCNKHVLRTCGISRRYAWLMQRLMVSDAIQWSRDIYIEHITGHRQYQEV
ncbi:Zinc finger and SCAN domain-containing protein 29 [Chelonia mydas]|uniref:Zinc finger and SCAN domain-containing protein 29 n=1 Tax=Chelonia mydas TaxID=8469 RepID=M7AM19_CHEMY|nr:Zinc finger and SCAN domain-containing protein 29 [Chelonia mydas]